MVGIVFAEFAFLYGAKRFGYFNLLQSDCQEIRNGCHMTVCGAVQRDIHLLILITGVVIGTVQVPLNQAVTHSTCCM